jgi:hypothetical protein
MQINADLDQKHCSFSLQSFGFSICGLGHHGNLRISGLIVTNLRLCDCGMSPRSFRFANCGKPKKICVLTMLIKCLVDIEHVVLFSIDVPEICADFEHFLGQRPFRK